MKRDQLRAAIEDPAHVHGGSVTSSLVQRVINDLYEHPDYLPVLQSALRRIWEAWRNSGRASNRSEGLRESGRTVGSRLYAETVYSGLSSPLTATAKQVFQRLTYTGPDNRVVRRPTRMAELCEVAGVPLANVQDVVARFRESLLIVTSSLGP